MIQCTNLGGMEHSALLLLDECRKMGHQTELLSINEMGKIGELLKKHQIPASAMAYRGLWGWRSFLPLRRLLKIKQADCLIMIGHNLMAMLALGSLCRGNRLLSIHFHHRGVKPDWAWRIIYRIAMARFNYIIFPSYFIMNEALDICPFLITANRTISYPIPQPMALPEKILHSHRLRARASFGLSPQAKVVGNAGWLIPRKRWDIFLRVAAQVAKEAPESRFLIAGDGPDLAKLTALADSLGLQNHLLWLGWQKNLKRFYYSLDVMLFNSDWDAMGRTPLEAMSYGIPVVASVLHGGLNEIIDSNKLGFLIDSHDVSRLAEKVIEILNDKMMAEMISIRSRTKVETVGSPRQHALRILDLLQKQPSPSSPQHVSSAEHFINGRKIVGLTASLTPYHHARWETFTQQSKASCVVLELSNRDEFPVMEYRQTVASSYTRITLFPQQLESDLSVADINRRIIQTLEQRQPACVCLNGYASTLAYGALSWCLQNKVPAILMSESTVWDEPRSAWKEWLKSRIVCLCSSALVGGTPHADYMARLGMPRERIFLGYDSVDNKYFDFGAKRAKSQASEIRKRRGLPEKYFLASARFIPKKNLRRLLEAYARYRELVKRAEPSSSLQAPWDLVLLGDGAGREDVFSLRTKLGLETTVHLAGATPYEALPDYYGLASAFIHASTTEQWGLVVNEAMASGLPVLVSNRCGCAPDLVQEGHNGFTFDPYDAEDIAQKMLQLSASPALLATLGNASREIIEKWSPQRYGDGLSQAAGAALSVPLPRPTWFDRLLIWILMHR